MNFSVLTGGDRCCATDASNGRENSFVDIDSMDGPGLSRFVSQKSALSAYTDFEGVLRDSLREVLRQELPAHLATLQRSQDELQRSVVSLRDLWQPPRAEDDSEQRGTRPQPKGVKGHNTAPMLSPSELPSSGSRAFGSPYSSPRGSDIVSEAQAGAISSDLTPEDDGHQHLKPSKSHDSFVLPPVREGTREDAGASRPGSTESQGNKSVKTTYSRTRKLQPETACARWLEWFIAQFTVPPTFEAKRIHNTAFGRYVDGSQFAAFSTVLIIANSVFVGVYTNFTLNNAYAKLDNKDIEDPMFMMVQIFNVLFLAEIVARMVAEKADFVNGANAAWNAFDTCVVLSSLYDYVGFLRGETVPQGLSWLRILRLFRVFLTVKLFRLPVFSHLRMITNALVHSAPVAVWAVVVLTALLYLFTVAFALGVARTLSKLPPDWMDDYETAGNIKKLERYFPSMGHIWCNLYMSVTGGIDWENVFDATASLSLTYKACFLIFTAIMFFLVINIVVGMVIERAFKVVRQDRDFWVLEATNQSQLYEERVRGLFHQMDLDVSGEVSWEEFSDSLNNPHVEAYLSFVELDTANLYEIFQLLDKDGSQTLEIEEFVDGIHDLRGIPTKVQLKLMHALLEDLHSLQENNVENAVQRRTIHPDPASAARASDLSQGYGGSGMGSRAVGRKSIQAMPEGSRTTVQFRGMQRSTEFQDGEAPPGMAPRRSVQRRTVTGEVDATG